jgi:dephospho-CoA kinase
MSDKQYTSEDIQALCNACSSLIRVAREQRKQIDRLIQRPPLQRLYVTKNEAAAMSGISTRKLEGMISEGALSTVRDSRAVMIKVEELKNLPMFKRTKPIENDAPAA